VERRSIFALLAKPITREQFILGKYAGLVLTLIVNLSVMTLAYYAVLLYFDLVSSPGERAAWPAPAVDPRLLVAIVLMLAELMLVTAVALFFSTFSSPLLSALLTLACWVAGRFNADLRNFETVLDSPVAVYLARVFYYVLPNLAPFDVKAEAVYGAPIAWSHVAYTLAYAAVYIGVLLAGAMAIFRRRDFK
jgi:ABC-type transport system involved in multi-copper enzyme maturation permease subunit